MLIKTNKPKPKKPQNFLTALEISPVCFYSRNWIINCFNGPAAHIWFFSGKKKWIVSSFTHKEQKGFQCTELWSLLNFLSSKNFNTIAGRRKVRFNFNSNKTITFRLPTQAYKSSERTKVKGKYSSLGHMFSCCWLVCVWGAMRMKGLIIRQERAF